VNLLRGVRSARREVLEVATNFVGCAVGNGRNVQRDSGTAYWRCVAHEAMFSELGKSGCKTGNDGYGKKFRVQLIRNRHASEIHFRLELHNADHPQYGDLEDTPYNRKLNASGLGFRPAR
jgi:hypothetical protein